jgi:pimeloyl-ACP methyl ester carboxylesterase
MNCFVPYQVLRAETRLGPTDVTVTGARQDPPIVLLSGLLGGPLSWEHQLAPLGLRFRVIVPELIGPFLGESPTLPDAPLAEEAGWIADVLDALGAREVGVVALWRGARPALRLAADAPWRVNRLALLSPDGVLAAAGVIVGGLRLLRREPVSALLPIPRRDLRRVRAPAMVLVGERARARGGAGALARQWKVLPNLVVTSVMPEAGRAVHRDQPAAANAMLIDFLLNGAKWRSDEPRPLDGPCDRRLGNSL